jgi:hypothetical protein
MLTPEDRRKRLDDAQQPRGKILAMKPGPCAVARLGLTLPDRTAAGPSMISSAFEVDGVGTGILTDPPCSAAVRRGSETA